MNAVAGKVCVKCGYRRRMEDAAPDYECPKCGIVYEKINAKKLEIKQPGKGKFGARVVLGLFSIFLIWGVVFYKNKVESDALRREVEVALSNQKKILAFVDGWSALRRLAESSPRRDVVHIVLKMNERLEVFKRMEMRGCEKEARDHFASAAQMEVDAISDFAGRGSGLELQMAFGRALKVSAIGVDVLKRCVEMVD